MGEVEDLINQLIRNVPVMSMGAIVTAVDEGTATCTVEPLDESGEILDVKLRSVINDKDTGLIILPEVGSDVIVSIIQNDDAQAFISQQSNWESILIHRKSNDQTVFKLIVKSDGKATLDTDELLFNGGLKGGLIEVAKLSAEIAKHAAFLTAIKTGFSTAVPVSQDGGAAIKATLSAAMATQQTADLSSITNDKFKH